MTPTPDLGQAFVPVATLTFLQNKFHNDIVWRPGWLLLQKNKKLHLWR